MRVGWVLMLVLVWAPVLFPLRATSGEVRGGGAADTVSAPRDSVLSWRAAVAFACFYAGP